MAQPYQHRLQIQIQAIQTRPTHQADLRYLQASSTSRISRATPKPRPEELFHPSPKPTPVSLFRPVRRTVLNTSISESNMVANATVETLLVLGQLPSLTAAVTWHVWVIPAWLVAGRMG